MSDSPFGLAAIVEANSVTIQMALQKLEEKHSEFHVPGGNSLGRIVAHIITSRRGIIGILGGEAPDLGWGEFGAFSKSEQFDPKHKVPSLAEMGERWAQLSEILPNALAGASPEAMAAKAAHEAPISDKSTGALVSFLLFHETYHVGQVGLMAKSATGEGIFSGIK